MQFEKFEDADLKNENSFLVPNLGIFFFFGQNFVIRQIFQGAGFKYDNIVFKFQLKTKQMQHIWSQIQAFSLFHEILQIDKFKGAYFKYENIIFKFQPKNTSSRIFGPKFKDFYFYTKP